MRMFERALARTELPVRFSQGFNPRPKLSLPLPRAVGVATRADVLVVELTQAIEPAEVVRQLTVQMPTGVKPADAWVPRGSKPIQPDTVTCEVALPADEIDRITERLGRVLSADTWPVRRGEGDSGRTIDLRQQLIEARLDEQTLCWTARIDATGSVRPSEVLAVFGLDPKDWLHRVCRTAVTWRDKPGESPAGETHLGSCESTTTTAPPLAPDKDVPSSPS